MKFGIYDEANKILYQNLIFDHAVAAYEEAKIRNSMPPAVRRIKRHNPHYVVKRVIKDGLAENLVGFYQHYKLAD